MKTISTIALLLVLTFSLKAQDSLRIKNYFAEAELNFGYAHPNFSSINSFLQVNGLNPISKNRFTWGGSAIHFRNKLVFGTSFDALIQTTDDQPGNRKINLHGYSLGVLIGWIVVQNKNLTIYPYARLFNNFFSLKIMDNQTVADATNLLNETNRNSSMDYTIGTIDLGLSLNKNFPQKNKSWDCPQSTRYLTMGFKMGYFFQADHNNVMYNNQILVGAPGLNYKGPYAKLSFGFGTRLRQYKWH